MRLRKKALRLVSKANTSVKPCFDVTVKLQHQIPVPAFCINPGLLLATGLLTMQCDIYPSLFKKNKTPPQNTLEIVLWQFLSAFPNF